MLKNSKKYFASFGLVALIFSLSLLFFPQNIALAQSSPDKDYEPMYFTPQIEIPNSMIQGNVQVGKVGADGYVNSDLLANYIEAIYNYGLGIGGVLATVMLMASGLIWLTSAGDSGKIGNAKKLMTGSIVGMVLLYGAFLLLNTINPDLVALKGVRVLGIKNQINADAADGIIDDLSNAPADTKVDWVCLDSITKTCADATPPRLNLGIDICREEKGDDTRPAINGTTCVRMWCCGESIIDRNQRNDLCKEEDDGAPCRLTSTGNIGSGYCLNKICTPCKNIGDTCSGRFKNYECVGASGFCGKKNDGSNDCVCPTFGGDCSCKKTW